MIVKESHFRGEGNPVDVVEIYFCDCCSKRIEPQDTICEVGKKHYCLFCYEKTEGADKE